MRLLLLMFILLIGCESEHGGSYSSDYDPEPDYHKPLYGEWSSTSSSMFKVFYFDYGVGKETTIDSTFNITYTVNKNSIVYKREDDTTRILWYSIINDSTMDVTYNDTSFTLKKNLTGNPNLYHKWAVDSVGDTTAFGLSDTLEFLVNLEYAVVNEIKYRYNVVTEYTDDSLCILADISPSSINFQTFDLRNYTIVKNDYAYRIDSDGLYLRKGYKSENKFKIYKEVK